MRATTKPSIRTTGKSINFCRKPFSHHVLFAIYVFGWLFFSPMGDGNECWIQQTIEPNQLLSICRYFILSMSYSLPPLPAPTIATVAICSFYVSFIVYIFRTLFTFCRLYSCSITIQFWFVCYSNCLFGIELPNSYCYFLHRHHHMAIKVEIWFRLRLLFPRYLYAIAKKKKYSSTQWKMAWFRVLIPNITNT